MKVIITGASGFVGTHLVSYLEQNGKQTHQVSLRTPDWKQHIIPDAQAIIHLAGIVHDLEGKYKDEDYYSINNIRTQEVFDSFLESSINDFVFFSTTNVLGNTFDGIVDENSKAKPITAYGKSKWEAEQYLLAQKLPEGKRVFIIRPCMIHGPGNKGNLNVLYQVVQKRVPWPLAKFDNQRSFVSIDNVSYVIHQLLINKNVPSGIYHLADDAPMSTNQLIETIGDVLGFSVRFLPIPKKGIQWLARIGDVLHLPITSERLQKLTENYVVSNQKVKQALAINHLPQSAEEGIRKTIESFKKLTK